MITLANEIEYNQSQIENLSPEVTQTLDELQDLLITFKTNAANILKEFKKVPSKPTRYKEDLKSYKDILDMNELKTIVKKLNKMYTKDLKNIQNADWSKLLVLLEEAKNFEYNYKYTLLKMVVSTSVGL